MVKVSLSLGALLQEGEHCFPNFSPNTVCCVELCLFRALFQMQLKVVRYSASG